MEIAPSNVFSSVAGSVCAPCYASLLGPMPAYHSPADRQAVPMYAKTTRKHGSFSRRGTQQLFLYCHYIRAPNTHAPCDYNVRWKILNFWPMYQFHISVLGREANHRLYSLFSFVSTAGRAWVPRRPARHRERCSKTFRCLCLGGLFLLGRGRAEAGLQADQTTYGAWDQSQNK